MGLTPAGSACVWIYKEEPKRTGQTRHLAELRMRHPRASGFRGLRAQGRIRIAGKRGRGRGMALANPGFGGGRTIP